MNDPKNKFSKAEMDDMLREEELDREAEDFLDMEEENEEDEDDLLDDETDEDDDAEGEEMEI